MHSLSRRGLMIVLLLVGALLGALSVNAQASPFIPAIAEFSASTDSVSQTDVEAGDATVTLSWYIVNVSEGQSLALDYWRQNGWISVLADDETLAPVGEREVTLLDPLSFGEPTFRLSLISGRNVVDQRYLTIPYSEVAGEAAITAFETDVTSLTAEQLNARNNSIVVSWSVENRPPLTNLVFEQVVAENQIVNVELPRATLYVASEGVGAVRPVAQPDGANVVLRLSLVNVTNGEIVASEELTIPVGDGSAPTASATEAPTAEALPTDAANPQETPQEIPPVTETPPAVSANAPTIDLFTVEPATVAAGSNVTMTWSVTNAATVQISEVLPVGTGLTYVQLPASGSVSVPLPTGATTTVTYILTARAADGSESTAQQVITIGA